MAGKVRSPKYPGLSLAEAIERVRELHAQEGTAHTSPGVAVKAWGYGGINGASARVLSAVRQYGLLDDVGDDVKISDRGLALVLEPENTQEYATSLVEASREPGVFVEILDEYPDGLPSEQGLVSHLVRKRAFTEDGAKKLNRVLRETMDLVGAHTTRHTSKSSELGGGGEDPKSGQSPRESAAPMGGEPHRVRGANRPERGGRTMHFEHTLISKGGTAVLSLSSDDAMTLEDVDDLYDWLGFLRRSIERRVMTPTLKDGEPPADADHG